VRGTGNKSAGEQVEDQLLSQSDKVAIGIKVFRPKTDAWFTVAVAFEAWQRQHARRRQGVEPYF